MDTHDPSPLPIETETSDDSWKDTFTEGADDQTAYFRNMPPAPGLPRTHLRKRRWPIIFLLLVVIIAGGGAAYHFTKLKPTPKKQPFAARVAPLVAPYKAPPSKNYVSSTYNLAVDYPQTWAVVDTAQKMTIISPAMQLSASNNSSVSGHSIVTIRNQQSGLTEFTAGSATATIESQKLTYTQPSTVQRAQTYLSFLTYAASAKGALDTLYVTGDSGYQAGQLIPESDVVKANPLITVSFASCATADCSGTITPISVTSASWKQDEIMKPITALLTSIVLED